MILRRLLQVLAVAISLMLGGGFVYVKAGGVIRGLPFNQAAEPRVLPSSKSMSLASPEFLSGAKSFAETATVDGATLEPSGTPLVPPPPSEGDLLPGSKSIILPIIPDRVTPPAEVLPGFKSTVIAPSASLVAPPSESPNTAPPRVSDEP